MQTQPNIINKMQSTPFSMPFKVNQHTLMQATLGHEVAFDGVGLHSGFPVHMLLRPAAPYTGFVFFRTDIKNKDNRVPAHYTAVIDTMMCTKISNTSGVTVSTIEHIIAALQGMGITNAEIYISGPEVPIMDGSSRLYTEKFTTVGCSTQSARQRALKIISTVRVEHKNGFAEFIPSHSRSFDVSFDFSGRLFGKDYPTNFTFDLDGDDFHCLLSDARTFGLYEDALRLKEAGFAKGASLENTIVLHNDVVMNEKGLRSSDELVRHKVLDAIGDLALSGCSIIGTFRAHNPGHGLNNQLLLALFANPKLFTWCE